jgi:hypothetical protein
MWRSMRWMPTRRRRRSRNGTGEGIVEANNAEEEPPELAPLTTP